MIGVDATRFKIIAFAFSSAFLGTAGALYASWVGYIDPLRRLRHPQFGQGRR